MLIKKLSSLTSLFYKLSQMSVQQTGDFREILNKAGLWGGMPFDLNGKVADAIFKILDKHSYQGKIGASITIDNNLNVTVSVSPTNDAIQKDMQATFGTRMSAALKKAKTPPPANGSETLEWLVDVGY